MKSFYAFMNIGVLLGNIIHNSLQAKTHQPKIN